MLIIVCTLLLLVMLMASLLLLRTGLLVITVDGYSMSPTLQPGDRVLVVRHWIAGRPRKSQIVVVTFAKKSGTRGSSPSRREELYIKRVVASAGESFTATLGANARPATNQVSGNAPAQSPSQVESWHIPRNHIFVCGDNVETSIDSRSWGPLALERVVGTVAMKLSPSATPVPSSTLSSQRSFPRDWTQLDEIV